MSHTKFWAECLEDAERRWDDMNTQARLAAIDPDGDRELILELMQFWIDERKKKSFLWHIARKNDNDPVDYLIEGWLINKERDNWVEQEALALQEIREEGMGD